MNKLYKCINSRALYIIEVGDLIGSGFVCLFLWYGFCMGSLTDKFTVVLISEKDALREREK